MEQVNEKLSLDSENFHRLNDTDISPPDFTEIKNPEDDPRNFANRKKSYNEFLENDDIYTVFVILSHKNRFIKFYKDLLEFSRKEGYVIRSVISMDPDERFIFIEIPKKSREFVKRLRTGAESYGELRKHAFVNYFIGFTLVRPVLLDNIMYIYDMKDDSVSIIKKILLEKLRVIASSSKKLNYELDFSDIQTFSQYRRILEYHLNENPNSLGHINQQRSYKGTSDVNYDTSVSSSGNKLIQKEDSDIKAKQQLVRRDNINSPTQNLTLSIKSSFIINCLVREDENIGLVTNVLDSSLIIATIDGRRIVSSFDNIEILFPKLSYDRDGRPLIPGARIKVLSTDEEGECAQCYNDSVFVKSAKGLTIANNKNVSVIS